MSKEQGEDFTRRAADLTAFDPHYVMPQTIKGDLDNLFNALGVMGLMAEAVSEDGGPVIALADMAPLHHSLSTLGKRLLADVPPQFAHGVAQA